MSHRVALVFCVHHKPWLIMSTVLTTLLQDLQEADGFFLYQVGDGRCGEKPSYQEYRQLALRYGENPQISPFDERVREVLPLRRDGVFEMEFENDHGLDSGAWYKFIRSERWRPYDFVFFLGEGVLLNRPNSISSILEVARRHDAHWIASGHEKRRLPREMFLHYNTRRSDATEMDRFHDRMIGRAFELFCKDPDFRKEYNRWSFDFSPETQNHVPDIWERSPFWYRLRNAAHSRTLESRGWFKRALLQSCRRLFLQTDFWKSWLAVEAANRVPLAGWWNGDPVARDGAQTTIHVDTKRRKLQDVIPEILDEGGVKFHRVEEPEWMGCAAIHGMSQEFLKKLHERLERYRLYEVLELPFVGTPLEVIWGFLPGWLGFEKWFTDGFHRVRKHFVTSRREDDPRGMASYINRYHRGRVCVEPQGDFVKIRAHHRTLSHLKEVLPEVYF